MARKKQPRLKVSDQQAMGTEPMLEGQVSRTDLIRALNWYNYYHDIKDTRKWILEYMKQLGYSKVDIARYNRSTSSSITQTRASMARLLMRGAIFENDLQSHIDSILQAERLREERDSTVEVAKVPTRSIENPLIAELEDLLDQFYHSDYRLDVTDRDLKLSSYSSTQVRAAALYYKDLKQELADIASDEQLAEAYSRLTKRQLNKYIKMVDWIVESLENTVVKQKRTKVRRPRKKKTKTADQLLKSFKYAVSSDEVDIVSIDPEKIIGASVLWTYNTKYRKLTMYLANDGGFSVKGTTLQNVNLTESMSKTLRKPEEILPSVLKDGKARIAKTLKDLKTKASEPNARINEQTLLLRAFK